MIAHVPSPSSTCGSPVARTVIAAPERERSALARKALRHMDGDGALVLRPFDDQARVEERARLHQRAAGGEAAGRGSERLRRLDRHRAAVVIGLVP
jgi:hypothetical protein